ncbi:MAG TPA: ATPase, T2SS/T4P/T4SS family [Thermoleophilia bacterium]|nr:ATPase, T2SS/T4P/T4SS family [Thermoleophilia bacterium]
MPRGHDGEQPRRRRRETGGAHPDDVLEFLEGALDTAADVQIRPLDDDAISDDALSDDAPSDGGFDAVLGDAVIAGEAGLDSLDLGLLTDSDGSADVVHEATGFAGGRTSSVERSPDGEADRDSQSAAVRHYVEPVDSQPAPGNGKTDDEIESLLGNLAPTHAARHPVADSPPPVALRPIQASKQRLGEIIVDLGLATPEQVDEAVGRQTDTRKRLGQLLIEAGVITELDLTRALGVKLGVEFIDLSEQTIDMAAANLIPDKLCRKYSAIPVRFIDDSVLLVAMVDPANIFALDDLKIMTGYDIRPAIASTEDVFGAIAKLNRLDGAVTENDEDRLAGFDDELADIREATEEAPIIKLVNSVIAQAVDDAASDIHFEPQAKELTVRFRMDGVLHEIMTVPRRMQSGVLSRLKIMAELDIAERRVPQDGRMGLVVGGKPIDMRVATLPTVYGEKVVMRLLDKSNVMLDLKDLGFAEKALKRFQRSFTKPYGAILVTGPTGSGKSTTLYATLNILNSPEKNVITVEDPVEYRLGGINQVQVNLKAGMTFAAALRSILRCDPDIVMIGEIRDRETAQIAVESALTGHLVLSTLHTNDAPGALSRLTEMGIEPFLTSSAVDCVLAQRLARRLCVQCRESYEPTREMLKKNDFPPEVLDTDQLPLLYRAKGCPRCNNTGYKGRLGLYEVMIVSEAVRRLTVERKSADEIGRVAAAEGMKTLREDGIEKVLQGLTSIEEIARVIV